MSDLFSLFLSQAYSDCWDDYKRSLKSKAFPKWDYVFLTASNKTQAQGYRKQIDERRVYLPASTKFVVIQDRDGKRVGSGGATLEVIRYLYEQEGSFDNLRILVIHSGGDSKRVPQYSALGKIFSPVPHELPDGRYATLFDEQIICMSSVPARVNEGMVLLSGDSILLFNPLQIDYNSRGATAISFKEPVETGINHGVYVRGDSGNVKYCLQKKSAEILRQSGAVNDADCVDIDTGAVIFCPEMLRALYQLVKTEELYNAHVNEHVRLSLYADFLYPLGEEAELESFYIEKPEGDFSEELRQARTLVWNVLRPFRMKLLRLAPAKFVHFGTTLEIAELMNGGVDRYSNLNWSRIVGSSIPQNASGYKSVLSEKASIGENCYLEVSNVHSEATVGSNCVLSNIDIHDETIPDDVVIHALKLTNGKFVVRIFGVNDNPKEDKIFGISLSQIKKICGCEIWKETERNLWSAEIYPQSDTVSDALKEALNLYDLVHGSGNAELWKNSVKSSLKSSFNLVDFDALFAWNRHMEELVRMENIAKAIKDKVPVKKLDKIPPLTKIQRDWLDDRLSKADFSDKMRLYYYIGFLTDDENTLNKSFQVIQEKVISATNENEHKNVYAKITADRHTVRLPLRVNWAGPWSDTPPQCIENGGTSLNCAILLNGEKPVEVTIERIDELKIVFDSRDLDAYCEYDTVEPLQATGNPFEPFALQKACLLTCGIIPKQGGNLSEILSRLGGGFVMRSEVHNVPKGSGLGTSSILAAACVKAMLEFMGIEFSEDEVYSHVFVMEQIMSTGGGWQDQVGGLSDGVKYITSAPGVSQKLNVTHLNISEETKKELDERFVLIYTGQRRLARNLLRDVVGRYMGNEPECLSAINDGQKQAALMRFELERGNVDAVAQIFENLWKIVLMIDKGSSNTLIDQIFASIEEMIDGRWVCGAGGGGFLEVILKKGVKKSDVKKRLKDVFMDSLVDVADCKLLW